MIISVRYDQDMITSILLKTRPSREAIGGGHAIKTLRQKRILSILRHQGSVEINDLMGLLQGVSRVTLRRDITEMAEEGLLRRTHGGAVLPDSHALQLAAANATALRDAQTEQLSEYAAIVMGPLKERGGNALRRSALRLGLPLLAESAPQDGGRYLGPDNYAASFALGQRAGRDAIGDTATVLHVCVNDLANSQERSNGFDAGFRDTFAGEVSVVRVNGQGHFRVARRVATDALRTRSNITIGFGVNDHSAIALIEAAEREGRDLGVYAVGGEDPRFVSRLTEDSPLRAVAALFPELVGVAAVDAAIEMIQSPNETFAPIITPHRIVAADNFDAFYQATTLADGTTSVRLRNDVLGTDAPSISGPPTLPKNTRIAFVPHYPSHEWYRLMGAAMIKRAAEHGLQVDIAPPQVGIAREVTRLRSKIAQNVAERITAGQTIILGQGEASRLVAGELARRVSGNPTAFDNTTIITNSLEIMQTLTGVSGLKVILTGGEFQVADQCLVGPSVGALFERMRADVAYLSIDGVSAEFGLSMIDERLAQTTIRAANAAKHIVAMADHICVGVDANHRVLGATDFDELVCDDGVLPDERERLRQAGVVVTIANEDDETLHNHAGVARITTKGRNLL